MPVYISKLYHALWGKIKEVILIRHWVENEPFVPLYVLKTAQQQNARRIVVFFSARETKNEKKTTTTSQYTNLSERFFVTNGYGEEMKISSKLEWKIFHAYSDFSSVLPFLNV